MHLYRTILGDLKAWKIKKNRKPLVIRGARQVGKSTAVCHFAKQFPQSILLNFDHQKDKQLFAPHLDLPEIIDLLYHQFSCNKKISTLIFLDEIQYSPHAVKLLRYFYEDYPNIYVIAAGSLLEVAIDPDIHFPVGRVDFLSMHPLSFREYLIAKKKDNLLALIDDIPLPNHLHVLLQAEFKEYMLIGGMPEVVAEYMESASLSNLTSLYEGLLKSFLDDVDKYASSDKQKNIIRHIFQTLPKTVGSRITFNAFAGSHYRTDDVKASFSLLEKTFLLHLIRPSVDTQLPAMPHFGKSPKLHFLDTGLINHMLDIQSHYYYPEKLNALYSGMIAEHIIGQELRYMQKSIFQPLLFWIREKTQSSAEVDYLYRYKSSLYPIEVKSGKHGRLRSLQEFINRSEYNIGIRIWNKSISIETVNTKLGSQYILLNLPFYLIHKLDDYIDWVESTVTLP
jgi:predicted AAA+ superfamily ATPase